MTSLNSGFPSRDTCCQGPWPWVCPVFGSRIRDLRRLAVAQTPITDPGSITSVGLLPCRVISLIGTWSAMLCTL